MDRGPPGNRFVDYVENQVRENLLQSHGIPAAFAIGGPKRLCRRRIPRPPLSCRSRTADCFRGPVLGSSRRTVSWPIVSRNASKASVWSRDARDRLILISRAASVSVLSSRSWSSITRRCFSGSRSILSRRSSIRGSVQVGWYTGAPFGPAKMTRPPPCPPTPDATPSLLTSSTSLLTRRADQLKTFRRPSWIAPLIRRRAKNSNSVSLVQSNRAAAWTRPSIPHAKRSSASGPLIRHLDRIGSPSSRTRWRWSSASFFCCAVDFSVDAAGCRRDRRSTSLLSAAAGESTPSVPTAFGI